jgi:PKD repeat protein
MAVAFSAKASTGAAPGPTSMTFTIAVPAGSTLLVIVALQGQSATFTATVGGVSMTKLSDLTDGVGNEVVVFYLVGCPLASSAIVSLGATAITNGMYGSSAVYTGVGAIGNNSSSTQAIASAGTVNPIVQTTAANSWVVGLAGNGNGSNPQPSGSPTAISSRTTEAGLTTIADTNGPIASSGTNETVTWTNIGSTGQITYTSLELKPDAFSVTAVATPPTTGNVPFIVAFTATPSGGVAPITYLWTFGDGGTSTLQNPSHQYLVAGTYTPSVTATDNVSSQSTATTAPITAKVVPKTGGTLGNNAIGRRPLPHISTPDRIENTNVNGGT